MYQERRSRNLKSFIFFVHIIQGSLFLLIITMQYLDHSGSNLWLYFKSPFSSLAFPLKTRDFQVHTSTLQSCRKKVFLLLFLATRALVCICVPGFLGVRSVQIHVTYRIWFLDHRSGEWVACPQFQVQASCRESTQFFYSRTSCWEGFQSKPD